MGSTLAKGTVGTISPILGVMASWQEQWEFAARFGGLLLGVIVGIFTLANMVVKFRQENVFRGNRYKPWTWLDWVKA